MKILFKYPTMGRPELFKKVMRLYLAKLSGEVDFEFVVSLNTDDPTMNRKSMGDFLRDCKNTSFHYAYHKDKIAAINADMEGREFDILFLISDDMLPQERGFDLRIVQDMKKHFPDTFGALHYDDGKFGRDRCITLSILGKKLYDHFGYIYHPDYKSFYCDNEFTDEVRALNCVKYFPDVLVKHHWRGNGVDDTYRLNSKKGEPDKETYERRKVQGFPKE
jgi:hypothetical protein